MASSSSFEYDVFSLLLATHLFAYTSVGIARMATKDDIYEGYTVPKGTIIVPNVWYASKLYLYSELSCNKSVFDRAIAHGPSADFDEQIFIPERFLAPDVATPDPGKWAFGFGRRSGNYLEIVHCFC